MAQDTHAVTHVMVDIETLGTAPGSAILSIGAVAFDPFTEVLGEEAEWHISLHSCTAAGLTMDPSTLLWWLEQSDAARAATFKGRGAGNRLLFVLQEFSGWLSSVRSLYAPRIWAHGASFDPILLDAAYRAVGEKAPWDFRDLRDTRTIFDLAGISSLAEYRCANDVHHSALSDAKVQARAVGDAYRLLGLVKPEVAA
ncbi:3'-5' exonuclease [Methylorubrum populi]|uniref:3'-5' exoribonuclease Rv2179c-like domain-containing protein n=1 Tax=Methylorubrum populi TaxID=223967 RepID=A0A833JA13_9HYPH|nr:3'-5' exonuclease [Methylorubrum populi]KAB7788013.1 hypothetical protein F8B43_0018 [Methylorubrum populi]